MRNRFIIVLALLLGICLTGRAQVFILNDNLFAERMAEIKAAVVDSLSGEPVPFASVYVTPSKDTTITNFTLSDEKGEATLDEVPFGSYIFHVEMMGYKPFTRERFFRDAEVDMGTIRMQQDERFLQAAMISDVGNPIVIKQDTVEFNASSFRVGANAMLRDLIERMPGMEITEDGKVKFNGQAIDKLTVGGRTFFFDDQSAALNNLPASVVDKIRVIDRESEQTRATGVQDGTRERVLDVALKKEYEEGWFGNLGLKGGTTVGSGDEDPLRDDRGLLYSANALVSAYTEKDQITAIANFQNINDSNGVVVVVISGDGESTSSLDQGLSTAAQVGVNANTSRIKDTESTVSVNYKFSDTDNGTRSSRTTHQEGGDLLSSSDNFGSRIARQFTTEMEFRKEKGKVWFHARPAFSYSDHDGDEASSSETYHLGNMANRSENTTHTIGHYHYTGVYSDISFHELGGKQGRVLGFSTELGSYVSDGDDSEVTVLQTAGGAGDTRALHYLADGAGYSVIPAVRYVEPFGEKWLLTVSADVDFTKDKSLRDAFDAAGRNDYYSSENRRRFIKQDYDLTLQYKFSQQGWITLGADVIGTLNETYSKSYGISETTGEGEWFWFTAPNVRFSQTKGDDRFSISMSGYSQRPGTDRMLPILNISNPSMLSLGNIYLRPYGYKTASASWTRNNREKFSTTMLSIYGTLYSRQVNYARWYDPDGILYSIPVNSKAPSLTAQFSLTYSTPLDEKKAWTMTLGASGSYNSSSSYQAKGTLDPLDKDNFDYSEFMARFWGDESGSRFYDGQSGFEAGTTRSFSPSTSASLRYNKERFSLTASVSLGGRLARYSLNPDLNMNTMANRYSLRGTYSTKKDWDFNTDISYRTYKGYSAGFNDPELQWNAEVSKNIGAFNLSVSAHDILDQTRNLTHNVTANYEEDTYRLIMGRYVLFGVKWNFGKMNAVHSRRAQSAALNMAL